MLNLIICSTILFLVGGNPLAPRITTRTNGRLHGKAAQVDVTPEKSVQVDEFFNIPYAEPPMKALRFQPPVSLTPAKKGAKFDAFVNRTIRCIQGDDGTGTEDCLVLTVRTPHQARPGLAARPVLVWVHGGGLAMGSGSDIGYSFDAITTAKLDCVTVNINYRLGFLGFACVKELRDEAAGVFANNGIRDMIAALEWVNTNIASFGGDPGRVTVVGNSGGATAVLALSASPLAAGLFQTGIAQSPAPEMRFSYVEGDEFQRTMVKQWCPGEKTDVQRKDCLYKLPAHQFSRRYVNVAMGDAFFRFPHLLSSEDGVAGLQLPEAEVVGLLVVDPVVLPSTFRQIPPVDRDMDIVISNLAQETGFQDQFRTDEHVRSALSNSLVKLGKTSGLVSDIRELYPLKSTPQRFYDTFTSDLRSTCPTNAVATDMANTRSIFRLYIETGQYQIPAFHTYDTLAMFGFAGAWGGLPKDNLFAEWYLEIVSYIAEGGLATGDEPESISGEWRRFPENTLVYRNGRGVVTEGKPQETICNKLDELDLLRFGWQNK